MPSSHVVSHQATSHPHVEAMATTHFQVVYIDKFADPVQSQWVTDSLCKKFHLNLKQRMHISSGKPVLLKQGVSQEKAEQLASVVKAEGGICWVQACEAEPGFHDRRQTPRRTQEDRRESLRTSAVVPDRRMGDRRQEYVH